MGCYGLAQLFCGQLGRHYKFGTPPICEDICEEHVYYQHLKFHYMKEECKIYVVQIWLRQKLISNVYGAKEYKN